MREGRPVDPAAVADIEEIGGDTRIRIHPFPLSPFELASASSAVRQFSASAETEAAPLQPSSTVEMNAPGLPCRWRTIRTPTPPQVAMSEKVEPIPPGDSRPNPDPKLLEHLITSLGAMRHFESALMFDRHDQLTTHTAIPALGPWADPHQDGQGDLTPEGLMTA